LKKHRLVVKVEFSTLLLKFCRHQIENAAAAVEKLLKNSAAITNCENSQMYIGFCPQIILPELFFYVSVSIATL